MMDMTADPGGEQIENALEWLRYTHPVTCHFADQVREVDLAGKSVSCWMHLLPDTILTIMPLVEAGVSVRIGACNPDSTDDRMVAYLSGHGVDVFPGRGASRREYQATLERFAATPADALCDMGGELIEAVSRQGSRVAGALEATTTGILRLEGLAPGFPVFNWNNIRIKDALHNRYHVGDSTWPAFSSITGMTMFGRTILVVGFGPVGRGVAERARDLGALVYVCERDPVRRLEALHFGCHVVEIGEGLRQCGIVVCATGRDGILGESNLADLQPETILFNVGHSNREIDVDWLDRFPRKTMKAHIDRYDLDGKPVFLLNRGSMVNLAATGDFGGSDAFDPFAAIMLRGLHWILAGGAAGCAPGVQDYPDHLEREVAIEAARPRRPGG